MTDFFEKYQGYILAGVAQVGAGILIAVRLNNRVRDLERRVKDLTEDLAAERKARAIDISEIKECMKADIEGVCDELRQMNQNIAGMREGYAEIVGFFRGQGFKIRGGE